MAVANSTAKTQAAARAIIAASPRIERSSRPGRSRETREPHRTHVS
jgi:hypothetical protein